MISSSITVIINRYGKKIRYETVKKQSCRFVIIQIFRIQVILRWYRARDLFGSQILVTIGGFELRISCIQSSYQNWDIQLVQFRLLKLKQFIFIENTQSCPGIDLIFILIVDLQRKIIFLAGTLTTRMLTSAGENEHLF